MSYADETKRKNNRKTNLQKQKAAQSIKMLIVAKAHKETPNLSGEQTVAPAVT